MRLNETKLFHLHGIFKKNEIKSAKRTPKPFKYIINPLSRNPGSSLKWYISHMHIQTCLHSSPVSPCLKVIKNFFLLNSNEHENYHAHKC